MFLLPPPVHGNVQCRCNNPNSPESNCAHNHWELNPGNIRITLLRYSWQSVQQHWCPLFNALTVPHSQWLVPIKPQLLSMAKHIKVQKPKTTVGQGTHIPCSAGSQTIKCMRQETEQSSRMKPCFNSPQSQLNKGRQVSWKGLPSLSLTWALHSLLGRILTCVAGWMWTDFLANTHKGCK